MFGIILLIKGVGTAVLPAILYQTRVAVMPDGAQQAILFNMIQFQLKPEDTPFHGPYFHVVGWCERVTLALGTTCESWYCLSEKHIFFPDLLSMV